MGILNENDSLENLELGDAMPGNSSVSLLTKSIRALLATSVLGSVAAFGAITVKPELVEYLAFIPGMEPVATQCSSGSSGSCGSSGSSGSSGSCGAAASCGAACGSDCGSPQEMTSCPSMTGEAFAETSSEADAGEVGNSEQ